MINREQETIPNQNIESPKIEYIPLKEGGHAVVFYDSPICPDIRLLQRLGLKEEIGKMYGEASDIFDLNFNGLSQQDIKNIDNYSLRKINLVLTLAKYMADKKPSPKLFAGYGDNQFAAMIGAGAFKSRKQAFELFGINVEARENALENGQRLLVEYSSFGKKPQGLKKSFEKLLEERGVFVSARHSDKEVVFSGRGEDIRAIKSVFDENKIKVLDHQKIALNCPLLEEAKNPVKDQLNKTRVQDSAVGIVSNSGEIISSKEQIGWEILKITDTIYWDEVLATINDKSEKGIKGQARRHPNATAATVVFLGTMGLLIGGKKILDSRSDKKK